MIQIKPSAIIVVVLWVIAGVAVAQPSSQYFRASVPVKTQSSAERKQATEDAFLQVLVRMSGTMAVELEDNILQKLGNAWRYVEQYQYEPLASEALEAEGYRENLILSFSPVAVRRVLDQAQMPFWSVNRPSTLVWLVEDDAELGKQLLNQYSETPVIQALSDAADVRGLPLTFPVLDMEDRLALSAEDVWDVNDEAIMAASERYAADVILVGRYSRTSRGELWSIWQFFHAGATRSYDSRVLLAEEGTVDARFGADALFPLADFLSARYAILNRGEVAGRLVLQLGGVTDFSAYRRSLDYLGGLAAVSNLHVAAVRGDTMLLFLESEASVEKLMSTIALGNQMAPWREDRRIEVPQWQQSPEGTLENPLRYRWSS